MVSMNEQISQLMDGELDDAEAHRLFGALKHSEAQREWQAYHLIGDALRDTSAVSHDFMGHFSERLAEEPTVLAPHRLSSHNTRTYSLVRRCFRDGGGTGGLGGIANGRGAYTTRRPGRGESATG